MDRITKVINDWDPQNLLSHAPEDEYSEEIELIKGFLKQSNDAHQVASKIKSVFSSMFGSSFKESYEDCLTIANKILD